MIAIVDYGAGNLRSVSKALAWLGQEAVVTSSPAEIEQADGLILPGVGSAQAAMHHLRELGLIEPLRDYCESGRPFLGVCLGLQLLFSESEEGGGQACLGLLRGVVRRLPAGVKIPHMGWNEVLVQRPHPILEGIPDRSYFYFVHSYRAEPADAALVVAETEHGESFASVVADGSLMATQFHPEKSAELGLQVYRNFIRMVEGLRPVEVGGDTLEVRG